jgi:hypothetical protein
MVEIMKLPLFLMVSVNIHIYFWICTPIRNPRVTDPDPAKVPDPCGSGSTTLVLRFVTEYSNYFNLVFFLEFAFKEKACIGGYLPSLNYIIKLT